MRNLKKILALVLALVMSMSLVVTANAFEDTADVEFKEAIEVLSGLKVFQGRTETEFAPDATIKRDEVAAIIYRIMTKDTADTQKSLYAEYGNFADVNKASWYAGYVGYCANAGIIGGYGDGNFGPEDSVTGYQALAMILRAVGYDKNAEFKGPDWKFKTAAVAKHLGITDNIVGSLDVPATREVVAEILFRAILVPQVSYNMLSLSYEPVGDSLGAQNFGLEYFEGVVTANEYADLNDSTALGEGETEIGDTVYAYSSELTDIGEARRGYAAFKNNKVLFIEDNGTEKFQTGEATVITKANVGMSVSGAKFFVNFDGQKNVYTSDFRLEYVLEGLTSETFTYGNAADDDYETKAEAVEAIKAFFADYGISNPTINDATAGEVFGKGDIHRDIKAEKTFYAEDVACMKYIFTEADKEGEDFIKGEVYVGTDSNDDISDDIKWSWKKFRAEYILDKTEYEPIEESLNGQWLKVVDNNGDGKAEYVFVTNFALEQVEKISKKGVVTMVGGKTYNGANDLPIVSSEELAVGNVLLVTEIDGTAYAELAPSFTGEVNKYNYKTEVLTVEGEEYGQSYITNNTAFMDDLEDADKDTDYTYYQDWFNHIRAFALPAEDAKELVLLTDGFYKSDRYEDDYAVDAYLNGEVKDYDIADNDDGFVNRVYNENGWNHLNDFEIYDTNRYDSTSPNTMTNLARYATDDDGELVLRSAKTYALNKKGEKVGIKTDYIDLTEDDIKAGQTRFDGFYDLQSADQNLDGTPKYGKVDYDDVEMRVNPDTVYYYVYTNAKGEKIVTTVTGYKNSLAVKDSINDILSVYAVATNVNYDSDEAAYWVADAIVVETETPVYGAASDVVLGVFVEAKGVKDFGTLNNINGKGVFGAESDMTVVTVNGVKAGNVIDYDDFAPTTELKTPVFYSTTLIDEENDAYIQSIEKNYAAYGIHVGTVHQEIDLGDYITSRDGVDMFYTEEVPVYRLTENSRKTYVYATTEDANGDELELTTGESYIFYTDSKDNIIYAVWVKTNADHDATDPILTTLYNDILEDSKGANDLGITGMKIKGQAVTWNGKQGSVELASSVAGETRTNNRYEFKLYGDANGDATVTVEKNGSADAATVAAGLYTPSTNPKAAVVDNEVYKITVTDPDYAGVTLVYNVNVTVNTANTKNEVKDIFVKGVKAVKDATQVDPAADGSSAHPWSYTVTLPISTAAGDAIQMNITPVDSDSENMVVNVTAHGNTGIKTGDASLTDTGALTEGAFRFNVDSEDTNASEVHYRVLVKFEAAGITTIAGAHDWSAVAITGYDYGDKVPAGQKLDFTATPATGYAVTGITYIVDGNTKTLPVASDNKYTIPAADMLGDKTVTINVNTQKLTTITADTASEVYDSKNNDLNSKPLVVELNGNKAIVYIAKGTPVADVSVDNGSIAPDILNADDSKAYQPWIIDLTGVTQGTAVTVTITP